MADLQIPRPVAPRTGDGLQYSLNGLDDVLATLEGIEQDMKFKGGRFALRKAAQVMQAAAVENASRFDDPVTAENIAANVAARWSNRAFKARGELMFRIGVLGGARSYANTKENRRKERVGQSYATLGDKSNPGGDTWYWRFLEFGTRKTPAVPFLRDAGRRSSDDAVNTFVSNYTRALERALRRKQKRLKG